MWGVWILLSIIYISIIFINAKKSGITTKRSQTSAATILSLKYHLVVKELTKEKKSNTTSNLK